MGRGLQSRPFAIFNAGGIDTKTDKRLVPAGNLVEVENMFMLKTGELRLRNGFAAIPVNVNLTALDNLFTAPNGALLAIPNADLFGDRVALKYRATGTSVPASWTPINLGGVNGVAYPTCTAKTRGVDASLTLSGSTDLVDGDMCVASGTQMVAWTELAASGNTLRYIFRKLDTGQEVAPGLNTPANRPPVVVAGGSSWMVMLYTDTAGTPSLKCRSYSSDLNNGNTHFTTPVLNGVSAAQPWIDAKPIPGGNLIAIAWHASAGGVSCAILDPSLGTISSTVNTPGADASMCLGWLDDNLATGNMYLATAGATSGVVVRTMSPVTMAVSATNVIDATATTNIRQITGYINTSATNYAVLWEVAPGPLSYYSYIRLGSWTGAASVVDLVHSFGLASRAFIGSDGHYHVVGSYESTVQPSYSVLAIHAGVTPVSQAQVMPGYAGGQRNSACSLSSPTLVSGVNWMALARRTKQTFDGVTVVPRRSVSDVALAFSSAALRRPRELGGTFFMPGGIVMRDDGARVSWATSPFYPEVATGVSSNGGGAMTSLGAYAYRVVWSRVDSTGRTTRTAGSVPFAITLGAADNAVTLQIHNAQLPPPDLTNIEQWTAEVYRSGPAAAGATAYNKVGAVVLDYLGGDTVAFVDLMSDAASAFGELLYSTGNVLEGFVTPSCSLLEVNGNRVGIVNAEDPTEFWPSLEYKNGQGLRFNPLLAIKTTGDGYGAITALAAMDGRWILFKSAAIHVIGGVGPNDTGQGSFNPPQAVSLSIGTVLPGSVVATPDGIMFQAAAGIYLLDRGLGLTYIGAPVEQYTLAENVVDASLVSGVTQVRFVLPSGRCLVWDYHHKRWYTFALRVDGSTVVACANSSSLGWCYALASGTVLQETPGVYSDVNVSSTAIVPRIGFPALALAGINGFERLYSVEVLGEFVGNHTLAVDFEYDYSGGVTETRTKAITAGAYQYEVKPATQKSGAVKLTLRTSVLAAGSGAFRLSGVTLWAGIKQGSSISDTRRLS